MQSPLKDFVNEYLLAKGARCYRHCQAVTKFEPLSQYGSSLVGAYVCPQSFVSRVVYFASNPDPKWFERFLTDQLGPRVKSKDIRKATRHGWELGSNAEEKITKVSDNGKIIQYYWTFYPSSNEEKENGTYLCSKEVGGCGKLYVKPNTDDSKLCQKCRVV